MTPEQLDRLTPFVHGFGKSILRWLKEDAITQPAQPQGEAVPYGRVTVVRRPGCADQHWFYRHPEPPYLDNAAEYHVVYTHPAPAQQPLSEKQEREAFEAWAKTIGLARPDGGLNLDLSEFSHGSFYEYHETRLALLAYRAGRAHGIGGENP